MLAAWDVLENRRWEFTPLDIATLGGGSAGKCSIVVVITFLPDSGCAARHSNISDARAGKSCTGGDPFSYHSSS